MNSVSRFPHKAASFVQRLSSGGSVLRALLPFSGQCLNLNYSRPWNEIHDGKVRRDGVSGPNQEKAPLQMEVGKPIHIHPVPWKNPIDERKGNPAKRYRDAATCITSLSIPPPNYSLAPLAQQLKQVRQMPTTLESMFQVSPNFGSFLLGTLRVLQI